MFAICFLVGCLEILLKISCPALVSGLLASKDFRPFVIASVGDHCQRLGA